MFSGGLGWKKTLDYRTLSHQIQDTTTSTIDILSCHLDQQHISFQQHKLLGNRPSPSLLIMYNKSP